MVVSQFGRSLRADYDTMNDLVPTPQNVSSVMQNGRRMPAPAPAPSLGGMMAPSSAAQAPMAGGGGGDFESKVARNESFLSDPSVQDSLINFAVSVMSPGLTTEEQQNQQKIDLANRQFGVETSLAQQKLALDKEELKIKQQEVLQKGGRKYSRLVDGDSPLGIELGLAKGTRARVEFTEDALGNKVGASVQDNPSEGKDGQPTQISKLNAEADAAEKAGNPRLAQQLRQAAEREASGVSFQGTLDPGTRLVPGEAGGRSVVETIPGSKKAVEEAAANETKGSKRMQEINTNLNLGKAIDRSLNQITQSNYPNWTLTGFGSYLENLRGTGANDLANNLNTVKSNLGFMKLQDIRDGSKTGGALGPVSDFENRLMQATVASVENSQSAEQLVQNLRYIKSIFTDVELQGKLSEIGRRLDPTSETFDPNFNEAQAVKEASDYLEGLSSVNAAAEIDARSDLAKKGEQIMPDPDMSSNMKSVWHNLKPDKQKRLLELHRQQKETK